MCLPDPEKKKNIQNKCDIGFHMWTKNIWMVREGLGVPVIPQFLSEAHPNWRSPPVALHSAQSGQSLTLASARRRRAVRRVRRRFDSRPQARSSPCRAQCFWSSLMIMRKSHPKGILLLDNAQYCVFIFIYIYINIYSLLQSYTIQLHYSLLNILVHPFLTNPNPSAK